MQQIPPEWLQQLDDILSSLETEPEAEHDARLLQRVAALDPDLLAFLVEQLAAQESPQAAALFDRLATQPDVPPAARERAAEALAAFAEQGIRPPTPGEETFHAGYVQQGRERGEQVLALSWRLPDGSLEAMVFLLDWRGDGLKDYYRTRSMSDAEWRELVAHNSTDEAPMVDVRLPEAKALVEAAIAEGRRFSRPLPREYRLDTAQIDRRLLHAVAAPTPESLRSFVTPTLTPEEVVRAYVAALHYRDYTLAALLLAPEHRLRTERTPAEAAEALRLELKHAPRRDRDVETRLLSPEPEGLAEASQAEVEATGAETIVERSGKRKRQPVRELYRLGKLSQLSQTWKIVATESANRVADSRQTV